MVGNKSSSRRVKKGSLCRVTDLGIPLLPTSQGGTIHGTSTSKSQARDGRAGRAREGRTRRLPAKGPCRRHPSSRRFAGGRTRKGRIRGEGDGLGGRRGVDSR